MNQCRRCHREIPEGETLCEACKANDENYLDDLLRSMDRTKTDHRSDLPKKKGAPAKDVNRKQYKEDVSFAEEGSFVRDGEFDDLDLEFSRKLDRGQGRSERGRRRRNRRRNRRENIWSEDFDLEGQSESFSERDSSAMKIADSLFDLPEDEAGSSEKNEEFVDDDIMAMLEEDGSGDSAEPSDDDIMAMLEEDGSGDAAGPSDDDIMAMLEEEGSGDAAEPSDDDIMAMLEEEGSGDADGPSDDDIMAMLEEEGTGDAEGPSDDDIMAMLEDDGSGDAAESSDDDIMAMLSEGDEPKEEDDVMALLSEEEGDIGLVNDDDLMALMEDEGNASDDDLGDLDDLMNMMESDDNAGKDIGMDDGDKDIFSLDDLLGDEDEGEGPKKGKINDVGDIISDSLSAVSSKEEESLEAEILDSVMEKKKDKKKKSKAGAFFAKLFGNVVDDKSKKQFEAEKADEEKAEFRKSEKARIKAGNLTEEELKQKAAKEAVIAQAKEEKKQKKDEKKAQAEAKKAEKLEKKKKLAQERAEEEALTVDEGRINRAGASIVFLFFAAVAVVVLIGSSRFSYATSIKNAGNYFEKQKYNKAYNEVSGLKIKDKDEEIYSKIMTVMYVNKELNSYNNYYDIQHYGEALDSLLKGLKRYDKYIADARELGIESDLNYVRRQILAELKRTFGLSESEALRINSIEDRAEYSSKVIAAAEAATGK